MTVSVRLPVAICGFCVSAGVHIVSLVVSTGEHLHVAVEAMPPAEIRLV